MDRNVIAEDTAEDTIMVDPGVYTEKLSYFSRMLRLDGFAA